MTSARWVTLISVSLFFAVLANGASSYLKRVGLLDHRNYEMFVGSYCGAQGDGEAKSSLILPCKCMQDPAMAEGTVPGVAAEKPLLSRRYVYDTMGYERVLKVFKDALFAGFVILSLFLVTVRKVRLPGLAATSPIVLLAVSVGVGFLISVALWGIVFASLGLRSFAFLAVAFVGGWAASKMQSFAWCAASMLLIQTLLVGLEFVFGIPLRFCPNSFRGAGTMVLSNSLGVFAVVALAFYRSFSATRSYFWLLVAMVAILLLASGSGTGLFALLGLLGMLVLGNMTGFRKVVMAVALLVLGNILTVKLPELTHRPDIYNSVLASDGRVGRFGQLLQATSATDLLVGRGVGFGTNTALNNSNTVPAPLPPGADGEKFAADSTVTVLLTQLGAIGILLFYGTLGWAFLRDRLARPTYAVIAITSLAINITEVFPVNFLLGLTLAHTIFISPQQKRASSP